ncbi:MAG: hypothetical protein JNK60_14080, partial [Acidobacteria bacterium]|nr:hypothetical protein [Acidobacteriota bacterium]
MRLLALLLTCSSLCGADEVPGFAPAPRAGPRAGILNPIVRPAPVSSGLAFALPVLRDGRLASDGRFTLPVSRTGAGLKLRFDSLVLNEDGALEGIVRLRN